MSDKPALRLSGLRQVIRIPGSRQTFTLYVDRPLEVSAGAFVGILGQTGCGKTTLLTVLGLLRGGSPESAIEAFDLSFHDGDETTNLVDVWKRNRSRVADRLRARHFGFALQHGELLPALTVAENIAFPLRINGWPRRRIRDRVEQLVEVFRLYRSFEDEGDAGDGERDAREGDGSRVASRPARGGGVSSLADVRINYLSGGQYQRVALARAVAHQPRFLFVDEPTASLNRAVARVALEQLRSCCSEDGARSTIFMVTHDEVFADEFCDRIVHMRPRRSSEDASGAESGAAGEVVFDESATMKLIQGARDD